MNSLEPRIVLVLGSGPMAPVSRDWPRAPFTDIVAINNSWRVRSDWDYLIHPEDFDARRMPRSLSGRQTVVTAKDYVPLQNQLGGFVYAGGTMAFTAAYWALAALRPTVLAFFGCDMVYPANTDTHFYGMGKADPLRPDVSLRSLEAKSARLLLTAARMGCRCVNLSDGESRLVFPFAARSELQGLADLAPSIALSAMERAEAEEQRLAYFIESGRYWEHDGAFDPARIDALDALWMDAFRLTVSGSHRGARAS
jgi:hypothetical protein